MTPEGKVKLAVKKLLSAYQPYTFWPVQTGFGGRTLDCLGMYKSYGFAIETKRPGKTLTPLQQVAARDIEEQGGAPVFIIGETACEVDGKITYSGMDALEVWLTKIQQQ